MELGFDAQRRYCQRLGIIPGPDEDGSISATREEWYASPQAQEISGLLSAMETHWRQMQVTARRIRDDLDGNDKRMSADEVHSSGLYSSSGIARNAIEYDAALAAYAALEDHLRSVVNGIRRAQGYEVSDFVRLEDHPEISPEEDRARREMARLERHLSEWTAYTAAGQRRHLRGPHGLKINPQAAAGLSLLHEQAHAGELAGLRDRVASFGQQPAS